MDSNNTVTTLNQAVLLGFVNSFLDDGISALEGCCVHRDHTTHDQKLPRSGFGCGHCQDCCRRPILRQKMCSVARLSQRQEEWALSIHCRLDSRRAHRLDGCHAPPNRTRLATESHIQRLVVDHCLCLLAYAAHDGHSVHREVSSSCFATQHDAVGAIEDSIGHITRLCTSWPWRLRH